MSDLQAIQQAIQSLSPEEQDALRRWFEERDAAAWDDQIERDAAAGKLDSLAAEAMTDYRLTPPREL
jgi:hypothetical protein